MASTVEQCIEELQAVADRLATAGAEDFTIVAALGEVAIARAKRGPTEGPKAWLRMMLTAADERNRSPVKCLYTAPDTTDAGKPEA